MDIKCFPTGMFGSNCYMVSSGNEAVIIDAGVPLKDIKNQLIKTDVKVKYIILTHGHLDHICSLEEIYNYTKAEILIHKEDAGMLGDPDKNLSSMGYGKISLAVPYKEVHENDKFEFGNTSFKIIHTPGHTEGGICIKIENVVFTGDTLFNRSVGRSDLPGGNHKVLIQSIREKLMVMDSETKVYPGHGPSSTIGDERNGNPFL